MKCPMLTMYAVTYSKPEKYRDRDCLKEECAWWDDASKMCAISRLAMSLNVIVAVLGVIKDKMPYARQFEK